MAGSDAVKLENLLKLIGNLKYDGRGNINFFLQMFNHRHAQILAINLEWPDMEVVVNFSMCLKDAEHAPKEGLDGLPYKGPATWFSRQKLEDALKQGTMNVKEFIAEFDRKLDLATIKKYAYQTTLLNFLEEWIVTNRAPEGYLIAFNKWKEASRTGGALVNDGLEVGSVQESAAKDLFNLYGSLGVIIDDSRRVAQLSISP
ncbi:hypothetical protein RUND412_002503 [Rhizina undulata]